MTLSGGIEAPFVLEIVEPSRRFLDRITIGDLVISIDHAVSADGDGSSITVTTHLEGPGADRHRADGRPADTPKALAALVEMAEKGS